MLENCPYGGKCIDPGYPSDCMINSRCVNFSSTEEKKEFESLPDTHYFKYENGPTLKFKNATQLQFLLADLSEEAKSKGTWGTL